MAPEKGDNRQAQKEDEARVFLHDEADIEDTICGIGPFRPRWIQVLANKEVYMVVFSVVGLTQGIFFTYMTSTISTIEKRFKFTSKETGIILSGNDVTQIVLSIVLGYYGTFGHRPRWVGMGVFFAAISGFLAALPHFIWGPGKEAIAIARAASANAPADLLQNITSLTSSNKKEELCYFRPEENCGQEDGRSTDEPFLGPLILLFISQLLFGITLSIFYSLGITYMDDNISKKTYPIYYSMAFMLRILGPVLGYFVGGKCLSVWIDPSIQPNITREDPRWYGAWWIGFMVIGVGLIFTGNLLFLFPRKLPETLKREAKKVVRQAEKDEKTGGGQRGVEFFASLAKTKKKEERPTMKNLLKALKRLFTNKIWVGNLFNTTTYVLGAAGYWNFKPKYLETQFRQSATTASYYTGMASMVSLVLGTGLGGAVLRWAHPGPRFVTGYNIFITLLTCCSYIILCFIGCPRIDVLGPLGGAAPPECSSDCGCSDRYTPVCAEDQTTVFYSACYAGCTVVNASASPIQYSDCQCVGGNLTTATGSTPLPLALPLHSNMTSDLAHTEAGFTYGSSTSGYCPEPCDTFFYYITIQMVIKTVASTGRVGSNLIHLRSVSDEDKGIALGTLNVFLSVFAFVPAPIMMGAIIDSACVVWDNSCGRSGNCWLYDTDKFRFIIHLVPAAFIFISVFGDLVVFYYSRQLDLYGKKEDDLIVEKAGAATDESQPLTTHHSSLNNLS